MRAEFEFNFLTDYIATAAEQLGSFDLANPSPD
jgi:hypothetical protein